MCSICKSYIDSVACKPCGIDPRCLDGKRSKYVSASGRESPRSTKVTRQGTDGRFRIHEDLAVLQIDSGLENMVVGIGRGRFSFRGARGRVRSTYRLQVITMYLVVCKADMVGRYTELKDAKSKLASCPSSRVDSGMAFQAIGLLLCSALVRELTRGELMGIPAARPARQ